MSFATHGNHTAGSPEASSYPHIGASVDYGNLDFFSHFPHPGQWASFDPSAFPKGYQEDVISFQIQIHIRLFHAEVSSSDPPNYMTKTSSWPTLAPGPWCRSFTVWSFLRGPHLLGWRQAARRSSCGTACGQQVEACLHRCCLVLYCCLPGWLPPAPSTTASTTACRTVTLSPLLPMSPPAPLPTLCSKRRRPSLGWCGSLMQLPICSVWDSGKEKNTKLVFQMEKHTKKIEWMAAKFPLFFSLTSLLQWKEKLQVILFPWLPLQDLICLCSAECKAHPHPVSSLRSVPRWDTSKWHWWQKWGSPDVDTSPADRQLLSCHCRGLFTSPGLDVPRNESKRLN